MHRRAHLCTRQRAYVRLYEGIGKEACFLFHCDMGMCENTCIYMSHIMFICKVDLLSVVMAKSWFDE